MIDELVFPKIERTQEPARLDISTRVSKSTPAALNVRVTLPDEKLVALTPSGDTAVLPRTGEHGKGLAVAQIQIGLN